MVRQEIYYKWLRNLRWCEAKGGTVMKVTKCAGKGGLYEDYSSWWLVQYNSCGASTLKRRSGKEAILYWNRRINYEF